MTTTIVKRPIPAARDPANRVTIESMRVAVSELSGTIGSQMQRAVRVCELVDAGILEFKTDGTVGRPGQTLTYELDQSLKLTGTALRLQGDFSNAVHAHRLMLQTYVPNSNTAVGVIPNGTATIAALNLYNAQDPDNAGIMQVRMDPTLAVIHSTKLGATVARDIAFLFEGVEKMRLSTAGFLTIAGGVSAVGSGNPAVPSGFAATVSGSFGGGVRLVDGSLQWGAYTTGDGSGGLNLHFANGSTAGAVTARVTIGNTGNLYLLSQDGAAWVRVPRVFVQSGDPGAQAADNDLWAWSGGLKRRSGGAWTTV